MDHRWPEIAPREPAIAADVSSPSGSSDGGSREARAQPWREA